MLEWFKICRSWNDFMGVLFEGKVVVIMYMEGVEVIGFDFD